MLPIKYSWLTMEPGPKLLKEALRHFGLLEKVGKGSHPDITIWAKEVGVSGWYTDDDIPWCGLFIGMLVKRPGYPFSAARLLAAKQWADDPLKKFKGYGLKVAKNKASLGDILVFVRPGGGHVSIYVGENHKAYLCLGGNQSNAVGLAWIAKDRCIDVRRPDYKVPPLNIRPIILSESGELSTNEA
jgi:uncharacterized protein (TIGR02594 family)